MGLRKNPSNHYINVFGERWTYGEALAGKMLEGHFESGPQAVLQTYIQLQAGFPTIQPLLGGKTLKGIHFQSEKPGIGIFASYSHSCPKITDFHIVLLIIFQNGRTTSFILISTSFSKEPVWLTPSVSSCWCWPAQPGIFLKKPKLENSLSVQRLRLFHSFCPV